MAQKTNKQLNPKEKKKKKKKAKKYSDKGEANSECKG